MIKEFCDKCAEDITKDKRKNIFEIIIRRKDHRKNENDLEIVLCSDCYKKCLAGLLDWVHDG